MRNNIVIFCVTDFCNAKCKTCSFWLTKKPKFPQKDQIKNIIKDIKQKLNCGVLTITGGEPTTYPYLEDLIKEANLNGIITQVITNGSLLNDSKIRSLSQAGLKILNISIDHYDEKIVEKNRAIKGLLSKIKENMKYLKKSKMIVQAGITISRFNYKVFEKVVLEVLKMGFDEMNFCFPIKETDSTYKLGNKNFNAVDFSDTEMIKIIDEVIRLKMKYGSKILHKTEFLTELKNFYERKKQNYPCKGGEKIFYLDNSLKVYQCMKNGNHLGEIGEKIDILNDVICYSCPLQCFREPSVYLQDFKLLPLIIKNLKSRKSRRLVLFTLKELVKDVSFDQRK